MLNFMLVWLASIGISYGININTALKLVKEMADGGYLFDIAKLKEYNKAKGNSGLISYIPVLNVLVALFGAAVYYYTPSKIVNELLVYVDEMTEEERRQYEKDPSLVNAINLTVEKNNKNNNSYVSQQKNIQKNEQNNEQVKENPKKLTKELEFRIDGLGKIYAVYDIERKKFIITRKTGKLIFISDEELARILDDSVREVAKKQNLDLFDEEKTETKEQPETEKSTDQVEEIPTEINKEEQKPKIPTAEQIEKFRALRQQIIDDNKAYKEADKPYQKTNTRK